MDAQSGKELARLNHDSSVIAVSYSPDGNTLATASRDGTARVWDAQSGKELARLNHDDRVNAVSYSPDGNTLATASSDKTARLWDIFSTTLYEKLCQRLPVNLSAAAWENYVGKSLLDYELACPKLSVHPSVMIKATKYAENGDTKTAVSILNRSQIS